MPPSDPDVLIIGAGAAGISAARACAARGLTCLVLEAGDRVGGRCHTTHALGPPLDLDAFEHNLDTMAALLAPTGTRLRAHAKTHKSPVIAGLQMARGAIGQCVQKVGEAEVLAWGGVPDKIGRAHV